MKKSIDLIPDEKLFEVHGNSNFGTATPRHVLNRGVVSAALGFHNGSTVIAILKQHGLIKKSGALTKKGFHYAQSIWMEGAF